MKIKVRVRPNSEEQSVERLQLPNSDSSKEPEEILFVKLKSLPNEGKANLEMLKLLENHFGKQVKIKSGFTSRNKIIEIED